MNNPRSVSHELPSGYEVNLRGGLVGLFGEAILTALKARFSDADHESTPATGAGHTGRPRAAGGQGPRNIRTLPLPERQVRDVQQVDGRPVSGQVYAFHRKPADRVSKKNTRPLT